MKSVTINEHTYELLKDYREGFELPEVESKLTDYFEDYDYIVGDWAYGKLRLKGFYDSKNKKVNNINNYNDVDSYIKDFCASDCKHFIIKKIN